MTEYEQQVLEWYRDRVRLYEALAEGMESFGRKMAEYKDKIILDALAKEQ
jgi:hypothetical protein